jgi:hypothetical protein
MANVLPPEHIIVSVALHLLAPAHFLSLSKATENDQESLPFFATIYRSNSIAGRRQVSFFFYVVGITFLYLS